MIIYIDDNCRCHAENDGTMTEIETNVFDGASNHEIHCYTYKPLDNGKSFIQCLDSISADAFHKQYETDEAAHLEELAALIDEIYNEDMEAIG